MYVKLPNPPHSGLRVEEMSEQYREDGLSTPDSGVVRVDAQTGEALLEHIPGAEEHDPDGGDSE